MLKKSLIVLATTVLLLFLFIVWFLSLLGDDLSADFTETKASELPYLVNKVQEHRGRILAVVTNVSSIGEGDNKRDVGYELTELARAYYVFKTNGFEVDVASPQGGKAPMVRDDDDMGPYDFAFLNDDNALKKINKTLHLSEINTQDYDAIYFVGGKGTMFDFPDNVFIKNIVRDMWQQGKVIAAVCHGPAALVNVRLDSGELLLQGREVASFSNKEELLFISDARRIFPYLLEDKLIEQGASYQEGHQLLNNVVVDGQLITGQNPWSVWTLADKTIQALGYSPLSRNMTPEEHSISLLTTYTEKGFSVANDRLQRILEQPDIDIDRNTIAAHVLVAILSAEFSRTFELLRLLSAAKHH